MQELPEVQSIINDLEKVLKGKTIKTIECYYPGTVITNCLPEDNPFPIRAGNKTPREIYYYNAGKG